MAMMIPVAYFMVICLLTTTSKHAVNGAIGLNWGRVSVQRLIPSIVVDLLLQNGVHHARVYTSQPDILEAFSGSGIHLTIGIYNVFSITNEKEASDWVQKNVPYFGRANIRRIYVGNYLVKEGIRNEPFRNGGIRTLTLVQDALNKAGYGDHIKVTLPQVFTVLKDNITRPSEAEFRDEVMEDTKRVLRVLHENNAPIVIDLFPAQYLHENNIDPSFAFANNKSALVVTDVNGAVYTNVFDFMFDAFLWALEKVGSRDLEVIVGQVGWPTDSFPGADTATAERFFKSLLPKVMSNEGTPKRPGRPIDTYVHSMTDESKMPSEEPFTRHWGIYRSNGEPKYKIDLTGQGRDIFPARAKGIMRMPDRWCVFNGNTTDAEKVDMQAGLACKDADCTSLAPGGSCSQLASKPRISYSFNTYFQSRFQDEDACRFDGLGVVVMENPSTGNCVFTVEVVRGHQNEFKTTAAAASDGKRLMPAEAGCVISLQLCLISIWAALF